MTPPATFEEAIQQIEVLARDRDNLARENQILWEQLYALRHGHFGSGTESLTPGQLALFGDLPPAAEEAPALAPAAAPQPSKKKGHGRAPFPEHLPREVIELDVPEDERVCPDCGGPMHPIGEDVAERGHVIPVQLVVHRYVKKKYACPAGHAVMTAAMPEGVVARGKYEASVYAFVATTKYADHQPLHRMEGIFKRYGWHIPKQTMWDLLVTVDGQVAQPILEQMKKELLAEPVLHSDETPVTMRLEEGKGKRTVYAWAWRNLQGTGDSKVLIEFRPNRSRAGPLGFLKDWSGTLITDGYSGYDEVIRRNGIVRAGCMAHARRKAREALTAGSKRAAELLRPMQRLFWLERAMARRAEQRELSRDDFVTLRREVRERRSRVVWSELCAAVERLRRDRATLPKSLLGKTVTYLVNQQEALAAFLADPRIPIHNNDTERDLRHLAVGRNNWMIFASPRGGKVACRLYSLVLSCKHSGVDPQAYLEDVLGRVATTPMSEIASLTPWGWKAAREERTPQG